MVERAHRWLNGAADWLQHLPWVLLDINNAHKKDSGKSAAEMVYGSSLTLLAQLAASSKRPVDEILQGLASAVPLLTRHGQKEAPTEPPVALASVDLVYVHSCNLWHSPTVAPTRCWRRGPSTSAWTSVVMVDHLKPHTGAAKAIPAALPWWGCPPREQPTTPAVPAQSTSPGLPANTGASPCWQGSQQISPLSCTQRTGGVM